MRSTSAAPEGVPRAGSAPESSNLFHKGLSERNRTTWQIWTPPFNPSQEVRTYRRAASKICRARPWIGFFRDFLLSKKRSKFYIEKTSKKLRKSSILVSQNPPKSLPKSFQNRCPKKHAIFESFLKIFQKFAGPLAQRRVRSRVFWCLFLEVGMFTFPPSQILPKSMSQKTCGFSSILVLCFCIFRSWIS